MRGLPLLAAGAAMGISVGSGVARADDLTGHGYSLPHRPPTRPIPLIKAGLVSARAPRIGPVVVVRRGPYANLTDAARMRFAGGMVDLYLAAPSGFHLSVGSRYYARTNFWVTAAAATLGRLPDTPPMRGRNLMRRTFNRFTPAATMGYDLTIVPGLVAGVEGGTLLGRAVPRGPRGLRPITDDRADRGGTLNPVATVSLRLAF